MPDDWKTPSGPRLIGHMNDASGYNVAFGVLRGDVIISRASQNIRLSAPEREHFQRLFMEAERQAETWAREHAEGSDE